MVARLGNPWGTTAKSGHRTHTRAKEEDHGWEKLEAGKNRFGKKKRSADCEEMTPKVLSLLSGGKVKFFRERKRKEPFTSDFD